MLSQNSDMANPKGEPSNVTRIARAVAHTHGNIHQIVYYQRGVGTSDTITSKLVGGLTGNEIDEHIREAYSFLANNFNPETQAEVQNQSLPMDQIVLLGFSRGAFTARAIASLISDIGLLTRSGMENFWVCRCTTICAWREKWYCCWSDNLTQIREYFRIGWTRTLTPIRGNGSKASLEQMPTERLLPLVTRGTVRRLSRWVVTITSFASHLWLIRRVLQDTTIPWPSVRLVYGILLVSWTISKARSPYLTIARITGCATSLGQRWCKEILFRQYQGCSEGRTCFPRSCTWWTPKSVHAYYVGTTWCAPRFAQAETDLVSWCA